MNPFGDDFDDDSMNSYDVESFADDQNSTLFDEQFDEQPNQLKEQNDFDSGDVFVLGAMIAGNMYEELQDKKRREQLQRKKK